MKNTLLMFSFLLSFQNINAGVIIHKISTSKQGKNSTSDTKIEVYEGKSRYNSNKVTFAIVTEKLRILCFYKSKQCQDISQLGDISKLFAVVTEGFVPSKKAILKKNSTKTIAGFPCDISITSEKNKGISNNAEMTTRFCMSRPELNQKLVKSGFPSDQLNDPSLGLKGLPLEISAKVEELISKEDEIKQTLIVSEKISKIEFSNSVASYFTLPAGYTVMKPPKPAVTQNKPGAQKNPATLSGQNIVQNVLVSTHQSLYGKVIKTQVNISLSESACNKGDLNMCVIRSWMDFETDITSTLKWLDKACKPGFTVGCEQAGHFEPNNIDWQKKTCLYSDDKSDCAFYAYLLLQAGRDKDAQKYFSLGCVGNFHIKQVCRKSANPKHHPGPNNPGFDFDRITNNDRFRQDLNSLVGHLSSTSRDKNLQFNSLSDYFHYSRRITAKDEDIWGQKIKIESFPLSYKLTSNGPDKILGTEDDIFSWTSFESIYPSFVVDEKTGKPKSSPMGARKLYEGKKLEEENLKIFAAMEVEVEKLLKKPGLENYDIKKFIVENKNKLSPKQKSILKQRMNQFLPEDLTVDELNSYDVEIQRMRNIQIGPEEVQSFLSKNQNLLSNKQLETTKKLLAIKHQNLERQKKADQENKAIESSQRAHENKLQNEINKSIASQKDRIKDIKEKKEQKRKYHRDRYNNIKTYLTEQKKSKSEYERLEADLAENLKKIDDEEKRELEEVNRIINEMENPK